jgi:hypothetical protein
MQVSHNKTVWVRHFRRSMEMRRMRARAAVPVRAAGMPEAHARGAAVMSGAAS